MPAQPGRFSARWLLHTPTYPDFGHMLSIDVEVLVVANNFNQSHNRVADQLHAASRYSVNTPMKRTGASAAPVKAEFFEKALEQIAQSTWEVQRECYATLLKIYSNIRSSLENPKFRRIPKTSKKLVSDVLNVLGGEDVLISSGFLDQGD